MRRAGALSGLKDVGEKDDRLKRALSEGLGSKKERSSGSKAKEKFGVSKPELDVREAVREVGLKWAFLSKSATRESPSANFN